MSAVRSQFAVVLLLALWLTATQHCGLEAAGLFGSHAEEEVGGGCCTGTADACVIDGCNTVEEGLYRPDQAGVTIATPQFAVICRLICSDSISPPERVGGNVMPADIERALDWAPTWQFVQRAALSPRAPSRVVA